MPGSKPIWFTEFGCPAVDKGTNQPNKFIDAKSSESALPAWSDGRRDDLIQMQYLLAVTSFWDDPANNPESLHYSGSMVDLSHAHVWAWDARPFPDFPGRADVWNDGDNYVRGHWLNGRATNQPLAAVVAEICARSGVSDVDTSRLYGLVRGFLQPDVTSARAALQPLLVAYGFDVMERDGKLRCVNRDGRVIAELAQEALALLPDLGGSFETSRAADVETAGQVRLGFVDAQSSYEIRAAEARFPDEEARGVSQTDLPLLLTRNEGLATVERWLSESRVARDQARFALPKSRLELGAGDVVGYQGQRYRIDRVEQAEAQLLDAVRVEPGVYLPSEIGPERVFSSGFIPPVPVYPVFLDLPLLTGEEVPHAPHIAVTAQPWPGTVGVWSASQDSGYELNRLLAATAVVGVTECPLLRASPGVWDRGQPLRVKLSTGELASSDTLSVLNGANALAIGDGSPANWEVLQFAEAQLVAPDTYELGMRLRGQLGTDGLIPGVWPEGSLVVLLDLALVQIDLPLASRGLARFYRIGASSRGYDDPNVTLRVEAFDGIGLRPYPVAHLRMQIDVSGNLDLRWKRRTRIDGDSWQAIEVPLGEDSESYVVRIMQGAEILAEYATDMPLFTYTASMQAADGVIGGYQVQVAQVSTRFGPGLFRSIDIPDWHA